jgi:hypothetical protein
MSSCSVRTTWCGRRGDDALRYNHPRDRSHGAQIAPATRESPLLARPGAADPLHHDGVLPPRGDPEHPRRPHFPRDLAGRTAGAIRSVAPQPLKLSVHQPACHDFHCAISQFVDMQGHYLDLRVSERDIRGAGHGRECRTDVIRARRYRRKGPGADPWRPVLCSEHLRGHSEGTFWAQTRGKTGVFV